MILPSPFPLRSRGTGIKKVYFFSWNFKCFYFFLYFSLTDKVPDPESPAPPSAEPDGAAPAAVAAEAAAEHDGRSVSQT